MKKLLITEEQYKRIFLKNQLLGEQDVPYKIKLDPKFKQFPYGNNPYTYDWAYNIDGAPDLTSLEGYPENWNTMTQKEKNDWILGKDLIPQPPKDKKGVPILKKKGPNGMYHWNKHIGAYVHPAYWDYPEVPAQFVLIPPKKENKNNKNNIDKLFKDNLQDPIDGNAFRKWIHQQPNLLKRINKILKEKYGEGLDKSSKYYNNKFIKDAFFTPYKEIKYNEFISNAGKIYSTVGEIWVEKEGNKKQRKNRIEAKRKEEEIREKQQKSFDFYSNHPLYQFADFSDWGKLEKVENSIEWDTYKRALTNWDKVNKFFGWTDPKSVNSENTLDILQNNIAASTCIDPTYLFNRYIEIYMKLAKVEGATDLLLAINLKFGDINNYFGDVEKPPKRPTLSDYEGDDEDKEDNSLTDLAIEPSISTYVSKKKLSLMDMLKPIESDEVINQRKRYEIQNKLMDELKSVDSKDISFVKDQLSLMNKYKALLEIVDVHNSIIRSQSKAMYKQACDDCADCKTHYASKGKENRPDLIYSKEKATHYHHEDGEISYTIYNTFTRQDMCKDNGGIFLIPTQPKKDLPAGVAIGFTNNQAFCCCVNPEGKTTVNIYQGGQQTSKAEIDINEFCSKSVGDIRDWTTKVGDWGYDCVNDWHCIADILSIALYAFGPAGAIISALVDGISAIGYVIEGDEGWEMNAGLTALGALGGFGEAASLAGKGVKFGSKLSELGTILKNGGADVLKIEDDIAKWSKTLSKAEKLEYDQFVKLSKSLDSAEGKAAVKKIVEEMKKLTPKQKGLMQNLLRSKTPDEILSLYNKSGKNLAKMADASFKGTRQAILQGVLFGGVHVFHEEIGQGLKKLYDKWKFDPLGIFDDNSKDITIFDPLKSLSAEDWGQVINDSPAFAEEIKEKINTFVAPTPELTELDKIFSSYWSNYKNILNNSNINKEIMDKLRLLHQTVTMSIDGRGLDLPYIKKQLSKAEDIYNKCIEDCPLTIKEVNDTITTIKNNEKEKISKEKQYAIVATGMEVTEEEAQEFTDLLQQALEEKTMEKKNLKEEIKRIKSLFTEERLYGNLIKEVNPDSDESGVIDATEFSISGDDITGSEAVEFLQSLDYIVKQTAEDDLCLGPATQLKGVYEKYKGTTGIGFKIGTSSIGCYLTLYDTDENSHGKFTILNLFEGPTGMRFSLYVRINILDCCTGTPAALSSIVPPLNFNAAAIGWDSSIRTLGLGMKYIKIEGKWINDGTSNPYKLKDGIIVKLLNKNFKGISTKYSIPGITTITIPGFKNDGATANTPAFMDDGIAPPMIGCISVGDYTQKLLGGGLVSDAYDLDTIVAKIK